MSRNSRKLSEIYPLKKVAKIMWEEDPVSTTLVGLIWCVAVFAGVRWIWFGVTGAHLSLW